MVEPARHGDADDHILACDSCRVQIAGADLDPHHWRCLNDSMWTPVPAVQVTAWRLLNRLATAGEAWANDQLEMLYLEEEVEAWARAGQAGADDDDLVHRDSNGAVLAAGDTVTLIKDLPVKGAGFTAKRGTAVRNISLSPSNEKHIEGRVNGQQIVILTEFVKKSV
ncbi:alkylphosphonate utilization protein [Aestuariispira insulae]|uniref:Alkylphosphonate utilization operon protein PhnA n=1 Tax=Aestuariispira insulae TaxID=1461337 RepID=A0A3D9HIF1_9PROT|nr:alkylphosphonate utilization protein [Aestuariispira insulae]RED49041.1 alkylphosphonate utilization operon protein PhnA [Aestuariispira insulae]